MAITTSKVTRAVSAGNALRNQLETPVVRTYEVTITAGDTGTITLVDNVQGHYIPVGGACVQSVTGAITASGNVTVQYGTQTVLTFGATIAVDTLVIGAAAAGVKSTEPTNKALTVVVTAGTFTTGTYLVSVTMSPLANQAKKAGVGI